jgi:hypothetical protein
MPLQFHLILHSPLSVTQVRQVRLMTDIGFYWRITRASLVPYLTPMLLYVVLVKVVRSVIATGIVGSSDSTILLALELSDTSRSVDRFWVESPLSDTGESFRFC